MTELEEMLIYKYVVFYYFPKKFGTQIQKRLIYMCMEKRFS